MPAPKRLTGSDVACWVIKTRTAPQLILEDWARGSNRELTRCVRPSYRVGLMQPGQRCLLWLSGREEPGVQAIGTLTSAVDPSGVAPGSEVAVNTRLRLLEDPVPRSVLLADHAFRRAEVLRMPAGSNPSYLTMESWAALCGLLQPAEAESVGW